MIDNKLTKFKKRVEIFLSIYIIEVAESKWINNISNNATRENIIYAKDCFLYYSKGVKFCV